MPIDVIGLGISLHDRPPAVDALLASCTVLAGGERMLQACAGYGRDHIPITAPLDRVMADIRAAQARGERICVLADGDPLLCGIGHRLLREFDPRDLCFHPGVSAMQTAAARLKIPWDQLRTVSLHGRPDIHFLLNLMARHDLIGIFTDRHWSPYALAREMLKREVDTFTLHVCQDLGQSGEKVLSLTCSQAAGMQFSPLNVILAQRDHRPPVRLTLGTPDDAFVHMEGLVTKREIRVTALGLLQIEPEDTVWDVGAGCGSIGLEASLLAREGRVFCVESNPERAGQIRTNRSRTGAYAVEVIEQAAPGCFPDLPVPDCIVIGGGLSRNPEILEQAVSFLRPGGRMVVLCTLLATLDVARTTFPRLGLECTVHHLQTARSRPVGTDERLAPLNPVFLVSAHAHQPSNP